MQFHPCRIQLDDGLADGARELGRPIAIAGFDNETWSELVGPGLTVIEQPVGDIGRMAMTLLFDRLKAPKAPARKVMLSGRLIVRGSTAPVTGLVDEPVE